MKIRKSVIAVSVSVSAVVGGAVLADEAWNLGVFDAPALGKLDHPIYLMHQGSLYRDSDGADFQSVVGMHSPWLTPSIVSGTAANVIDGGTKTPWSCQGDLCQKWIVKGDGRVFEKVALTLPPFAENAPEGCREVTVYSVEAGGRRVELDSASISAKVKEKDFQAPELRITAKETDLPGVTFGNFPKLEFHFGDGIHGGNGNCFAPPPEPTMAVSCSIEEERHSNGVTVGFDIHCEARNLLTGEYLPACGLLKEQNLPADTPCLQGQSSDYAEKWKLGELGGIQKRIIQNPDSWMTVTPNGFVTAQNYIYAPKLQTWCSDWNSRLNTIDTTAGRIDISGSNNNEPIIKISGTSHGSQFVAHPVQGDTFALVTCSQL